MLILRGLRAGETIETLDLSAELGDSYNPTVGVAVRCPLTAAARNIRLIPNRSRPTTRQTKVRAQPPRFEGENGRTGMPRQVVAFSPCPTLINVGATDGPKERFGGSQVGCVSLVLLICNGGVALFEWYPSGHPA